MLVPDAATPEWCCDEIENRRSSRGRWVRRVSLEPEPLLPAQSDLGWLASLKHTTPSSLRVLGWVTVTHPHHPLCGQQVEIIRVRRGPDPDLIIRHVDGYHGAIAASWTSYASATEALASEKPPLLDLEGLCHLARCVEQLEERSRHALKDQL